MRLLDVLSEPWAITPEKKQEIDAIYATHLRGEKIDLQAIEAAMGQPLNNEPQGYDVVNGVAVLPVDGVLSKRMNLLTRVSGGTSTELLTSDFQQALDDPSVQSIMLRIDSPGGAVDGVQQLAEAIYAARGTKPIVALADGTMASGAYWIGAAADRVYATSDTTVLGSVGVVATHIDRSGAEAQRGVKTTEITAGKYKRIASGYAPLSQEGRQTMQDQVDHVYGVMLDGVAKYRGAPSAEAVHNNMADGRLFIGQQAVEAGLIDGVMPFEQLLAAMVDGNYAPDARAMSARATNSGARAAVSAHRADAPPHTAGAADGRNSTTEEKTMADTASKTVTADDAKPFVDAALAEAQVGFDATLSAARAEAATQGATAERTRIQAVLAQSLAGHEALIQTLAFDGTTTGPEAAVQVLSAERASGTQRLEDLKADGSKVAPHAAAPETEQKDEKKAQPQDPRAIAKQIQTYQAEQKKLGITVSAAQALAAITSKEG